MIALNGPCCPTCGHESLSVTEDGGRILCTHGHCSRPGAAHDILTQAAPHHTATIARDDFTLTHPLIERLDDTLHACPLTRWLRTKDGPPVSPGKYRVVATDDPWAHGWLFERTYIADDGGRVPHDADAATRAEA